VFPELLRDGLPFYAMRLDGAYWRDIGTPDEYRRATEDVLCGRVVIRGARATGIPPSAVVASDARIEGPVRIGDNALIASGVLVSGPSVIGDGVQIGEGATLERTIVWNGSMIGPHATLRDAIVGERYIVAEGAVLDGAIVANEPAES
jgi:NDP-sugar pyrophosphorylase family protein